MLDHTDAVVLVMDAHGRIIDGNRALEALLGRPVAELAGRRSWDAISGRLVGGNGARLARRGPLPRETTIMSPRGERRCLCWSTHPIRDAHGHVSFLVTTGMDITDLKRAEGDVGPAPRRPSEHPPVADEDALAIAAHDLRMPLTVVAWQAEALHEWADGIGEPTVAAATSRILTAARQMGALISDLLDVAILDAGIHGIEADEHDLRTIVDEVLDQLGSVAKPKGIRVSRQESEPMAVRCDRPKIARVLFNLLGNAAKFTPRGGQIGVALSHDEREVTCTVTDTGPGIPNDRVDRIFDRYFSGGAGTGLGLFIARALVQAHGGRIWVDHSRGAGATLSFALPRPVTNGAPH